MQHQVRHGRQWANHDFCFSRIGSTCVKIKEKQTWGERETPHTSDDDDDDGDDGDRKMVLSRHLNPNQRFHSNTCTSDRWQCFSSMMMLMP